MAGVLREVLRGLTYECEVRRQLLQLRRSERAQGPPFVLPAPPERLLRVWLRRLPRTSLPRLDLCGSDPLARGSRVLTGLFSTTNVDACYYINDK